jgi:hypothetical protein
MILADQHRLDASRAELNAKNGLSALNCFLVLFRFMFISHDLKSLLRTYFSGERQFSFHSLRTLLIGNCFFRVRVGDASGAAFRGNEGASSSYRLPLVNASVFSPVLSKPPAATKRRCRRVAAAAASIIACSCCRHRKLPRRGAQAP